MEASVYEDVLRTLLGSNAYILFTLHKIISQALKQLQMLLVEETSQRLLDLYTYERQRGSAGSMCEGTYRNNARMVLEGDDCFQMEQMYAEDGGELLMAFLPEKPSEEPEDEGEEGEEGDEEEEEDQVHAEPAEKSEWAAYMDSFVQVSSSAAQPARRLLLARALRKSKARPWRRVVLLNGLECRAAIGSCKLRFVNRSEDVWYSNTPRGSEKRKASREASRASKKQALTRWLDERSEQRGRDAAHNALSGLRATGPVQLPNASTWKPHAEP